MGSAQLPKPVIGLNVDPPNLEPKLLKVLAKDGVVLLAGKPVLEKLETKIEGLSSQYSLRVFGSFGGVTVQRIAPPFV
jgi:hypothetical protein